MLRLAQKEREGAGIPGWRMLVAGKGLGEDVTNGAAARRSPVAARPVAAARKEEQGRRESEREERFKKQREEMHLFCPGFYGARR